jgi:hypothetical protein
MSRTIVIDKDLGWNKIQKGLFSLNNQTVKIGYWGQGDSPKTNIAARAAIHEFGTKDRRIPKRSFMRTSFDEQNKELMKKTNKLTDKFLVSKSLTGGFLKSIGLFMKEKIQDKIRNGDFKPLKPETIRKKGSSKPLIDKGQLVNSIDIKIE